ncbi:MAG: Crp/Fnr family transcriptional regulator [Firmicutes bacterium]|nr:Crp/Fnr family transcriptional regulator [Bacillota bacterium]
MDESLRAMVMLKRLPLWQGLAEEELLEVAQLMEWVQLSSGERIDLQGETGEALFMVAEGMVKLSEQSRAGEVTLGIFGEGSWLDELALFTQVYGLHRLEVLIPTDILRLDKMRLAEYLESRPRVGWQILQNVASLASARRPISKLCRQTLDVRLARYLVGLAQYRGIISPGGVIIDYPLQVADIQMATGAREGDMVQALRSLVARDILDLTERVVITSLDQLEALAYGQGGPGSL